MAAFEDTECWIDLEEYSAGEKLPVYVKLETVTARDRRAERARAREGRREIKTEVKQEIKLEPVEETVEAINIVDATLDDGAHHDLEPAPAPHWGPVKREIKAEVVADDYYGTLPPVTPVIDNGNALNNMKDESQTFPPESFYFFQQGEAAGVPHPYDDYEHSDDAISEGEYKPVREEAVAGGPPPRPKRRKGHKMRHVEEDSDGEWLPDSDEGESVTSKRARMSHYFGAFYREHWRAPYPSDPREMQCAARGCPYRAVDAADYSRHASELHTVKELVTGVASAGAPLGSVPFTCPMPGCTFSTAWPSFLATHMHSHAGERNFACVVSFCGKRFATRDELQDHSRKFHTPLRPPPLQMVPEPLHRNGGVTIETVEQRRCTVPGCKYIATSAAAYSHHVRTLHMMGATRNHICAVRGCGKRFSQAHFLMTHMLWHRQQGQSR